MDLEMSGTSAVVSRGSIVTIGSVDSQLADPLVMDCSAAEAAPAGFSKSLSSGRFTRPEEEVAALVVMAASSRAGDVTGADLVIDGGLVSTL